MEMYLSTMARKSVSSSAALRLHKFNQIIDTMSTASVISAGTNRRNHGFDILEHPVEIRSNVSYNKDNLKT